MNKTKENNDLEFYKDHYEFSSDYMRELILDTIKDWKMTELFQSDERNLPYSHNIVHFISKGRDGNPLNKKEVHEGIPDQIIYENIRPFTVEGDLLHDMKFDGCLGWSDDSVISDIHRYLKLEDNQMLGVGTGMRVNLGLIRDYLIDEGIIKGVKNFNIYK